jgi:hypothetical protein
MDENLLFKLFITLFVVGFAAVIALYGTIAYVVGHFIHKIW